MTPGRAALVGLVRRYMSGLMDPFVSLLEVHKLMYFARGSRPPSPHRSPGRHRRALGATISA
jgi:hypothetical protein